MYIDTVYDKIEIDNFHDLCYLQSLSVFVLPSVNSDVGTCKWHLVEIIVGVMREAIANTMIDGLVKPMII